MFKNIRKNIAILLSALALGIVPIAAPALASADDVQQGLCGGIAGSFDSSGSSVGGTADCSTVAGNSSSLNDIATKIINIFSWIVGVASVIMIIYGGFRYITSGGDSNGVSSAKNTIIYAIIGLVIVALAQAIVAFVINKATTT